MKRIGLVCALLALVGFVAGCPQEAAKTTKKTVKVESGKTEVTKTAGVKTEAKTEMAPVTEQKSPPPPLPPLDTKPSMEEKKADAPKPPVEEKKTDVKTEVKTPAAKAEDTKPAAPEAKADEKKADEKKADEKKADEKKADTKK